MSALRRLYLFLLFLLLLPQVGAVPAAIPGEAGLVATFRDFSSFKAALGAVRSLQGMGDPGRLPDAWSSFLLLKIGVDLVSGEGIRSLGIDPRQRLTVAYMEQQDLLYVAAAIAPEGLNSARFELVLRKVSGWTGRVIQSRMSGVVLRGFARRRSGYGLFYFVHRGTLVVCNTLAAARSSLEVLAGRRAGFPARQDPFFLQPGAALYATADGINRFFRYQIPYDSFFQDFPLAGFFRSCILGVSPDTGAFNFRFLSSGTDNRYIRFFRGTVPPAAADLRMGERAPFPLSVSARLTPEPAVRMLLASLPEAWQTAFFVESIRIKNRFGVDILRDLVWNWDGGIQLHFGPEGGRSLPVLGLSFYRPVSPALLLDPLRKRGALTAVKIRDGIHYCTLAAPLPLFGTGAALLFRDRTLFIAPTGGALGKLRRRLFPFPATGGIFVGATPGRIVGIMGKKDARNDLRTFLQTFSRAGLFLMEARHSGPYIYFKLRQKPER